MANTIQRFKEMTVGENTYKLQFTIKSVIMLEPNLPQKSILKELTEAPFSYKTTFEMLKWALIGGGNKVTDDKVEALFMEYLEDNNLGDLQELLIQTLMASGTIGKVENDAKN